MATYAILIQQARFEGGAAWAPPGVCADTTDAEATKTTAAAYNKFRINHSLNIARGPALRHAHIREL